MDPSTSQVKNRRVLRREIRVSILLLSNGERSSLSILPENESS
jgi:hypothetical protein